jgi:5-methyltetrahydrofolate--homocysteine methyltransferase
MAMANGLRLCIANPSAEGIMETVLAGEALLGHDQYLRRYLERVTPAKAQSAPTAAAKTADDGPEALAAKVYEAILDGRGEAIAACVQAALAAGVAPRELVNGRLIPAITEVGSRYERKEYYLPQLLCSGNAMEQAMSMLTPLLKGDCETQGPKVILATVQGDIHDIGKNIVGLMLGNYGFQVIDLGKDVPKERIVEAAKANDVRIVCLSALMTTTMGRMREVIAYAREQGLEGVDFIVGGAVVDENFAQEIGALYASDAMGTVRLAQRLTGAKN